MFSWCMSAAAKAVQQREPGAGTAEETLAASGVGAAVADEFAPAVAVARERAHGLELERAPRG